MVTPPELLELAQELLGRPGSEPHRRAAVSRAYYAAFHHLREIAEDRVGLPQFGTSDDHRDLESALGQLDPGIATEFAVLRRERNAADYDVEQRFSAPRAATALQLAQRMLAYA